MKYTLIIPGRLDNLNDYIRAERANRYKGAQYKANNEAIVAGAIKECLRGIHINKPVNVLFRWYEKNKRRDPDNISSFGHKVILDALVNAKVIEDDGWNYIKSIADEFYVDPENPRIDVTLLEVGG